MTQFKYFKNIFEIEFPSWWGFCLILLFRLMNFFQYLLPSSIDHRFFFVSKMIFRSSNFLYWTLNADRVIQFQKKRERNENRIKVITSLAVKNESNFFQNLKWFSLLAWLLPKRRVEWKHTKEFIFFQFFLDIFFQIVFSLIKSKSNLVCI